MARRDVERRPVAGTLSGKDQGGMTKTGITPEPVQENGAPAERAVEVGQLQLQGTFQDSRVDPMTVKPAKEGKEFKEDSADTLNPTDERRGEVGDRGAQKALKKFQ